MLGCGRQAAGPGETSKPSGIKPLPEKKTEIAGVQVTTGGGSVTDGEPVLNHLNNS
jgi:hypothetical protein